MISDEKLAAAMQEGHELMNQIGDVMPEMMPEVLELADKISKFLQRKEFANLKSSTMCAAFGFLAGIDADRDREIRLATAMFFVAAHTALAGKEFMVPDCDTTH